MSGGLRSTKNVRLNRAFQVCWFNTRTIKYSNTLLFYLIWPSCVCLCVTTEGPCLVHSMNGDLLRTLEGPDGCVQPRLVMSSTEGHCVIYYDKGHFCVFSINGKLLGHMEVEDNIKVNMSINSHLYVIGSQVNKLGSSRMSICSSFSFISFHFCCSACVLSCQLSGVWLNAGMICLQASLFPLSISLSLGFWTLRVQICPLICRTKKCHSTCMCVWECARERNGQQQGLLH